MEDPGWKEGDVVVLKHAGDPAIVVRLAKGPMKLGDAGLIDLSEQLGRPPGERIDWLGTSYRLVRPSLADLYSTMTRGAQIITAKDAARILSLASIGAESRVGEAGSGSGGLTVALAHAVGPRGRVVSIDRRPEALRLARENVERAGFADRVTWSERDVVRDGWPEGDLDAVVLDLAEPWAALEVSVRALRAGGIVVGYVPTYNQLERTVRAMREASLDEVQALEVIERALHVGDGGTRPSFDMLGHTGFLASARKVDTP